MVQAMARGEPVASHHAPRHVGGADPLTPYVPTLASRWLDDHPQRRHQRMAGSLVFLDLSGFTALSEKLSRQGRVGAEMMTDVLNTTFTALLDEAYEFGGRLLKFGGDALLLWFTGPDHQLLAAATAANCRRQLAGPVGRIDTPSGGVRLRMTAGVHSGEVDFFLVGDRHRELVVTGPGASQVVRIEGSAETGQVVVGDEVAAAIEAAFGSSPLGPHNGIGRLLAAPLTVPRPGIEARERSTAVLDRLMSADLASHLRRGGSEPEHRQVVTAFVHFDGTDHLVDEAGPEAAAERLDALVSMVEAQAARHEVTFLATDIDVDGGKIILAAGAPRNAEDKEERLLRTCRAIVEARPALPVRIGVNGGWVFTGDVGSAHRRTYTLIGDAVNTAARVMAHAGPGEVLTLGPNVDRCRATFDTEALPPFHAKGKSEPLVPVRIGPVTGERTRVWRSELVDRQEELAALTSLLRSSQQGQPAAATVVGLAGIGKTRLIEEALRDLPEGVRVLRVRGSEYEHDIAYGVLAGLLRAALGDPPSPEELLDVLTRVTHEAGVGDLLPVMAPVFSLPIEANEVTATLSDRAFVVAIGRVTVAVLERVAPDAVMVVDSLEWVDPASIEIVVDRIPNLVTDQRWLLVAASREPSITVGDVIELGELPDSAMRSMVRSLVPEGIVPDAVEALVARAGGSPLFLEELVAARGTGEEADLDTLEGLIGARIDDLSPPARRVLRELAVWGTVFPTDVLHERAALTAGDIGSMHAELTEFVEISGSRSRFRNPLVQEVAYAALPLRHRRDLHGEIADRMATGAGDRHLAPLSVHLERAGRHDEVVEVARTAGRLAEESKAYSGARDLYRRAYRAARRISADAVTQATVLRDLGVMQLKTGRQVEAEASFRRARRICIAAGLRAELAGWIATVSIEHGDPSAVVRWAKRGLAELGGVGDDEGPLRFPPDGLRARLLLSEAFGLMGQGRARKARAILDELIGSADDRHQSETLGRAYSMRTLLGQRVPDLAVDGDAERALARLDATCVEYGTMHANRGVMAHLNGRWSEAEESYRSALAVFEAEDLTTVNRGLLEANLVELLVDQGRLDEAVPRLDALVATCRALERPDLVATAIGLVRAVEVRRARWDAARAALGEWEQVLRQAGADPSVDVAVLRAEIDVLAGTPVAADRLPDPALAPAVISTAVRHRVEALLALRAEDVDRAYAAARRAYAAALEEKAWIEHYAALDVLARLRPESGHAAERDELAARLGLVAAPTRLDPTRLDPTDVVGGRAP